MQVTSGNDRRRGKGIVRRHEAYEVPKIGVRPHMVNLGDATVEAGMGSKTTEGLGTLRILHSHSQHVKASRQALHRIANSSEHPYTTRPALDVLAQPTKCDKLDPTILLWASVNLVIVAWALQVLIELHERPERRIAQKALVFHPIPRALRRPRLHRGRWFFPTQGSGE